MASTQRQILNRLVTLLQGINGSGAYTYDLSGTDQIIRGRISEPTRIPLICIYGVRESSTDGPSMGRLQRELTVGILGFVASTSDNGPGRVNAALDLIGDIRTAIEANRTLYDASAGTALATNTDTELLAIDDGSEFSTGIAVVDGSIVVTYNQRPS